MAERLDQFRAFREKMNPRILNTFPDLRRAVATLDDVAQMA